MIKPIDELEYQNYFCDKVDHSL